MEFVELTLIDGSKEYLECGNFMKDLEETAKEFELLTLICESGNMVPYHSIVKWKISKDKPFKTIGSRVTRDGDKCVKHDIHERKSEGFFDGYIEMKERENNDPNITRCKHKEGVYFETSNVWKCKKCDEVVAIKNEKDEWIDFP